jgi:hypothetical protein
MTQFPCVIRSRAIYAISDITPNLSGVFGGYIDIIDVIALLATPVLAIVGARGVVAANMEFVGAGMMIGLHCFLDVSQ